MLERQKSRVNSNVRKVFSKATAPNIYINPGEKIRITKSENKMKKIVAFELARYVGAPSRSCEFTGSSDINSKKIYDHIKTVFSDYTWYRGQSQGRFDIYSYDAGVTIENKTAKRGQSKLMFNASVYPDVVSKTKVGKEGERFCEPPVINIGNTKISPMSMDVLVLCIEREPKNNVVYDYVVVDGAYWGIDENDYDHCARLFNDMNDPEVLKEMMAVVYKRKGNQFAKKIRDGKFVDDFKLRKLISLRNPVGKTLR